MLTLGYDGLLTLASVPKTYPEYKPWGLKQTRVCAVVLQLVREIEGCAKFLFVLSFLVKWNTQGHRVVSFSNWKFMLVGFVVGWKSLVWRTEGVGFDANYLKFVLAFYTYLWASFNISFIVIV